VQVVVVEQVVQQVQLEQSAVSELTPALERIL
jgi:hypothetical protein